MDQYLEPFISEKHKKIIVKVFFLFLFSSFLTWTSCTKYNYEVEEYAETLVVTDTFIPRLPDTVFDTVIDTVVKTIYDDTLFDTLILDHNTVFPTGTFLADISFDTLVRRDERIFKIFPDSTGEMFLRRDSLIIHQSYWNWTFIPDTFTIWKIMQRNWSPTDTLWEEWKLSTEVVHYLVDSISDTSFIVVDSSSGTLYVDHHTRIGDMNYNLEPFTPKNKE